MLKNEYKQLSFYSVLYNMERVCKDFPNQPVYVMSDVDPYYEKLGYRREGSIFGVKAK